MRIHRIAALAVLAVLLAAVGTAVWRSAAPRPTTAANIAAELRCPACQGESVAQSQSPMAAAMRDAIATQLSAGRSPSQIRDWLVDRYGPEVLADPPARGWGIVLWLVPALVAAGGVVLAVRASRRPASVDQVRQPAGPATGRRARRVWDAVAFAVIVMVGIVALASPQFRDDPAGTLAPVDTDQSLVSLARSLEDAGRYLEAAEVYRELVRRHPDDQLRLRLAFSLLRSDRPKEAGAIARDVLTRTSNDPNALLLAGLADRASGAPEAAETLRRFLRVAPQHPGAAEVRRLLVKT